jgi:Domain of unknown function (DUF4062)
MPRFQIFVSSTFSDLIREREFVVEELNRCGYIAVGMEQFPATDEDKFEYIQRMIEESDYYIVIIRARYGSVDRNGVSYTQKEYEYAVSIGRPTLAFIYELRGELAAKELDPELEKQAKLREFISDLENKKIAKYWKDKDGLTNIIKDSIFDITRRRPGIGWIRGDQAIDPKIVNELESVRRERNELKQELDRVREGMSISHTELNSAFLLEFEVKEFSNGQAWPAEVLRQESIKATILEITEWLSESLYREVREDAIKYVLKMFIQRNEQLAGIDRAGNTDLEVTSDCIRRLRYKLEAFGLVRVFMREREAPLEGILIYLHWSITDKTKKILNKIENDRVAVK